MDRFSVLGVLEFNPNLSDFLMGPLCVIYKSLSTSKYTQIFFIPFFVPLPQVKKPKKKKKKKKLWSMSRSAYEGQQRELRSECRFLMLRTPTWKSHLLSAVVLQ
ncbi:hypothetical protein SCA6_018149 [Theobroma cacao]